MAKAVKPTIERRRKGDLVTAAIWNTNAVANVSAYPSPYCDGDMNAPDDDQVECEHCANGTHPQPWRWKKLNQVMLDLGYLGFCEFCGAPYEEQEARPTICDHSDLIECTTFSDSERQYLCRKCGQHITEGEHYILDAASMRTKSAFSDLNRAMKEAQKEIGNAFLPVAESAIKAMAAMGKAMSR